MTAFKLVLVCVGVLAVNVSALSDDERSAIRTAIVPLILECSKEYNVQEDDIKTAKESSNTTGLNPCFLGCFLKKVGIIDGNDLFDLEKTREITKAYIKGEEDLKKFESIGKICLAVNDKTVSGDNPDCERAKLLLDCLMANKADFTLFKP